MIPFIISLVIAVIACVSIICRFQDIVLRTGLVITVVLASLISFWLITLYAGKPLESIAPDDMIVYGHAIDIHGKKIYIMLKKPNDGFPPTMIELPYDKKLGKALKDGAKGAEGKPFRLKKNDKGDGEEGQGQGDGENQGEGEGSLSLESQSWELMPLPAPILPPKNTSEISKDSA